MISSVVICEGSVNQSNVSAHEGTIWGICEGTWRETGTNGAPRGLVGLTEPVGRLRVRATAWHCLFFANKNFPRSLARRTLRDADPHYWRKRGAMTSPRAYRVATRTARINAGRCDDHPSSSPRRRRRRPPRQNDNRPRMWRTRARLPRNNAG